ncbi:MAG: hypothetical protein EP330_11625, partial [Deltaproteobacteria bacterium]
MILEAFATSLLHSLWQLTGIGAGAAVLLHAQQCPRRRYATGVVGLSLMAWAPIATTAFLLSQPPGAVGGPGTAVAEASMGWHAWLVGAWTVGVVLTGTQALVELLRIEHLHFTGISAPPDLQARFERLKDRVGAPAMAALRLVPREMSPVAVGFLRPTVLLPAALLARLSPQQLEAVLVHELV